MTMKTYYINRIYFIASVWRARGLLELGHGLLSSLWTSSMRVHSSWASHGSHCPYNVPPALPPIHFFSCPLLLFFFFILHSFSFMTKPNVLHGCEEQLPSRSNSNSCINSSSTNSVCCYSSSHSNSGANISSTSNGDVLIVEVTVVAVMVAAVVVVLPKKTRWYL
jgi:hypothetical protein